MASGALPRPGDVVDRYQVIAEVARGGMAAVFAARRQSLGGFDKVLAIKMLLPGVTEQHQAVERFLDEARIASRISHPNVVEVIDIGEHDGLPYILMEFLRGQSLSQVSRAAKKRGTPLPLGFRLAVLARAAEGLSAAHSTRGADGQLLGIVHRDVSPQNIHIGYDGVVKVVDFGIAAARGRLAATTAGEFRGKLSYAAPEQLVRSGKIDAGADLWALGVVGWELLAARRLFRGDDERNTIYNVLERPVANLRAVSPRVPEGAARAIMRCLERNPLTRLSDAAVLARALDEAAVSVRGDRRQDVAALMNELLGADRAAEDERLAAAERGNAPPLPLQLSDSAGNTGGGSLTALTGDRGDEHRTRRPLLAAAAVGLLVVAGGTAAWVHFRSDFTTRGSSASAPVVSAPSASVRKVVHIAVPDGLAVALVDGQRHDERPLALRLAPGQSASVELVGRDGRRLRQSVSASDDGRRLEFPASKAPAPSASVAAPASVPAPHRSRPHSRPQHAHAVARSRKSGSSPLLADPY